ncbi:PAS domain S-box protein [candidate division KSB1 bacterium]
MAKLLSEIIGEDQVKTKGLLFSPAYNSNGNGNGAELKSIFRAAPIGVGLVVNRVLVWTNEKFLNMTGYREEEVIGENTKKFYRSDKEFERIGREKYKQIRKYGVGTIETKLRKKNGDVIDVILSSTLLNESDFSEGVIFTALDITNRKKTEKELIESKKQLDSILRSVHDIIYRLDAEGNITFISESIRRYGFEPAELIGRILIDMVHPDDVEKAKNRINERRTGDRRTRSLEIRLHFENDITVPMEIVCDVLHNEPAMNIEAEGIYSSDNPSPETFIGTQGIARDISDRIKAGEEKKILEEQLFQAQKMESIGRLAGGIAHDFNNILTSIMGYAELMRSFRSKSNSPVNTAAEVIINGAERAAALTRQLLNFARKGNFNPVPIDINNVIRETVKVSEKIFDKNIETVFSLMDKVGTIEADKHQLEQVLTNLLINARDAMPSGGRLEINTDIGEMDNIYIRRCPELIPGSYVIVSIRDFGIGMTKEVADHIFEPFFTTKGEGKGTGLGLATVYGIVKNHKGHIDVESAPGKGTVFNLFFPVSEKAAVEPVKEENPVKGNATILVIDDEKEIRKLFRKTLGSLGYKVLTAENGRIGVEIYQKKGKNIDLVILDMVMPELGGKETFSILKKINPEVKVIISSGYSKNEKTLTLLKDGIFDFIQKPFKINELSIMVSKILDKNGC